MSLPFYRIRRVFFHQSTQIIHLLANSLLASGKRKDVDHENGPRSDESVTEKSEVLFVHVGFPGQYASAVRRYVSMRRRSSSWRTRMSRNTAAMRSRARKFQYSTDFIAGSIDPLAQTTG